MRKVWLLAVLFSFCLNVTFSFAQLKGLSKGDEENLFDKQLEASSQLNMQKNDAQPTGNIVDPKYYFVGAGDILSIQVFPLPMIEIAAPVSPENTLTIPRIGQINVKGLTLAQVKDSITKVIQKRNSNATVYVSLKQARTCLVTISGNVLLPGAYTLPASYRISTVIKFANQTRNSGTASEYERYALFEMNMNAKVKNNFFSESGLSSDVIYAERNITLIRKDGISQNVDIEYADAVGDVSYDPFIKEGDEIYVPFANQSSPLVSISGAVFRPSVFAYKSVDKISSLIKMGKGLKAEADGNNIYFFDPSTNLKEQIKVDSAMNLLTPDKPLNPGSMIIVGKTTIKTNDTYGSVSIKGEVANPGVYLISKGKTRLKDIIDMAGGFSKEAYLPLAQIMRKELQPLSNKMDPKKEMLSSFQYSDLSMEDTVRFQIDMMLKKPLVSCDFVKAFTENSELHNVYLNDGDVISIPANPRRVFVYGQVNHPGYVQFEEKQNMKWYIEKAGGFAEGAEKKRARIVKGASKVWIEGDEETYVNAGDEIYVPRPKDVPPALELQKLAVWVSVISTLGYILTIYLNSRK